MIRKDGSGALKEAERRQWLIVGRIAVEIDIVGRFCHRLFPRLHDTIEQRNVPIDNLPDRP
jgi:hypothetical protein